MGLKKFALCSLIERKGMEEARRMDVLVHMYSNAFYHSFI